MSDEHTLTLRRKRKQKRGSPTAKGARKSRDAELVAGDDGETGRYIRRRGGVRVEFYDLGMKLAGGEYVEIVTPTDENFYEFLTREFLLADDPFAESTIGDEQMPNRFRLPTESQFYYLDLILKKDSDGETIEKKFLIGERESRQRISDLGTAAGISQDGDEWKYADGAGVVARLAAGEWKLAIESAFYYLPFDTGNTAEFTVTHPSGTGASTPVIKASTRRVKVYLVPRAFTRILVGYKFGYGRATRRFALPGAAAMAKPLTDLHFHVAGEPTVNPFNNGGTGPAVYNLNNQILRGTPHADLRAAIITRTPPILGVFEAPDSGDTVHSFAFRSWPPNDYTYPVAEFAESPVSLVACIVIGDDHYLIERTAAESTGKQKTLYVEGVF